MPLITKELAESYTKNLTSLNAMVSTIAHSPLLKQHPEFTSIDQILRRLRIQIQTAEGTIASSKLPPEREYLGERLVNWVNKIVSSVDVLGTCLKDVMDDMKRNHEGELGDMVSSEREGDLGFEEGVKFVDRILRESQNWEEHNVQAVLAMLGKGLEKLEEIVERLGENAEKPGERFEVRKEGAAA